MNQEHRGEEPTDYPDATAPSEPGGFDATRPVSYTHLDVYKRQRMVGAMSRTVSGVGMTSQRTRTRMIDRLREQGIRDERVLAAIAAVPRHVFVEEALASRAYEDTCLLYTSRCV